jgi:hypothetical protein
MTATADSTPAAKPGPFDRLLGVFTEVRRARAPAR